MLDTIKMKFFLNMREIEEQRDETMATLEFQQWMKDLNVSQSYEDPKLKHNALDLMNQYDTKKYSNLNFKLN